MNGKNTKNNIVNNMELRSEKIRNLLGELPPVLVRWGTAIIAVIVLTLLAVVCLMPYPYSHGESILRHILM
ncbi:MAG: hypothetical protein PUC02_08450 [Bacteroidales bacterium]|nr:hypothetical protein [Bacteroidales bacterium]MDY3742827.1 hypothetical protein [Prevotella sp.]